MVDALEPCGFPPPQEILQNGAVRASMGVAVLSTENRTGVMRAAAAERLYSLLWAAGLGLLSGAACVGVRLLFRWMQYLLVGHGGLLPDAAARLSPLHRALVPTVGAVLATVVVKLARRWFRRKHLPDQREGYVEAVRFEHGRIPFASTAWSTASSTFSVATGAAIGREGSMIQFATALTSWLGSRRTMHGLSLPTKVACGVAAAVAAAYQAPIAAVFFVYEIVLGEWDWRHGPQLAVSSVAGWLVARTVLGAGPLFAAAGHVGFRGLLWTVPLALLLALLGPVYQKLLHAFDFLRRLPCPLVWGGVAVGLLSVVEPKVWGNGDAALLDALQHSPLLLGTATVLMLRLCATGASMGAGTVGGVFTPTLFAGASLGLIAAHLVHAPEPLLLVVTGLSVLLASATHAPWMAAWMAVELTGQWQMFPLLVVLNLAASKLARRISPHTLYEVAEPEYLKPTPAVQH